jgi:hypothetical protein
MKMTTTLWMSERSPRVSLAVGGAVLGRAAGGVFVHRAAVSAAVATAAQRERRKNVTRMSRIL